MAREQHSLAPPWALDAGPLFLVLLIAAHVLGLISDSETTATEAEGSLKEKMKNMQRVIPSPKEVVALLTQAGVLTPGCLVDSIPFIFPSPICTEAWALLLSL
ncbi:hypothetical protein KIW84_051148 [Lathyrus oleraceus]|uniref:Uncharacterized protein n=1 Tax=Pisum sativum TaxID=3888 RepID=A0A9D4WNT1_PEA|nr:hypothetical protein KIW84_051148 [Pisum sativum]